MEDKNQVLRHIPRLVPDSVSDDEIFSGNLPTDNEDISETSVSYVRAIKMYCITLLRLDKIAEYAETSVAQLRVWIEDDDWKSIKKDYCGKYTPQKVLELEENTIEAHLTYSKDIEEQIRTVSDGLLKKAFIALKTLSDKDVVNYALKFKELEAKVAGKINGANFNNSTTNVYQMVVDRGAEQYYGDAGLKAKEITCEQRPQNVGEAFSGYSDDE